MINVITGKINSGKTTKIINLYDELQMGDGFVSIKNMIGNKVHSYEIMQLSTRQKQLMVLREDFLTDSWCESCKIGPYSFSKDTLENIENTIRKFIKKNITPIFLDEIGPLELHNKCFHTIFRELLDNNCELYITIRKDSLEEIIKKYDLANKIKVLN
ncbi:hypothetical protein SH1V18_25180 [Vallitalea longa]|uniref:Uncharacterized protein n=1 Tax=Vallitalea longa TaxID=2936439 RepID=A0A9W5YCV6_9FIRM|nr:nucleoside-triphosphatase [Vallitalea longa]GKX30038.1 hypothetical protein SH1V18_25180 [Vallitalea longa]